MVLGSRFPSDRDRFERPTDPDRLPDSHDPTGPCPRCQRSSNFRVIGSIPVTFTGRAPSDETAWMVGDALTQVSALLCYGCGQAIVVVEDCYVGEHHSTQDDPGGGGVINHRGIHWWPTPGAGDLDPAIPDSIAEAFGEGVRCLSAGAPRGAAVMLRRTLEAIVREQGSEAAIKMLDDNLASALKQMGKDGTLHPSLASWADEIRLTGNAGGHFDPLDNVTEEEAKDLSTLVRKTLNVIYEVPAQLRRARDKD